ISNRSLKAIEEIEGEESLPKISLGDIGRLSDNSGLPISFFLSAVEPETTPVKFRQDRIFEKTKDTKYYYNRDVMRLMILVDLVTKTSLSDYAKAEKTKRDFASKSNVSSEIIAQALGVEDEKPPIGPKIQKALERIGGLVIFYYFYPKSQTNGVSFWHKSSFPVIGISRNTSIGRANFTLAHEIVHLFCDLADSEEKTGFICNVTPSIEEEKRADKMAARLLMPERLKETVKDYVGKKGVHKAINELAFQWEVSRQALALRLRGWNLADEEDIKELFVKPTGGRPTPIEYEDTFGSPYRTKELIKHMYDSGATTRFISWATRIKYEHILGILGQAESNAK
ncbi:ImmA/IrrE family metallo-endopeptidase, partial [Candidatus Peregrinibacteria bacterium]|nr:ImmA/IrrE family metallo-endopeptidase [Candidatus Peregrinibacteria bacterium]